MFCLVKKMNAHKFINDFGIEKANRIIKNVVYGAEYYSENTGSYYSYSVDGAVKISKLRQALSEYGELMSAKRSYETRQKHWNASVNKDFINDH